MGPDRAADRSATLCLQLDAADRVEADEASGLLWEMGATAVQEIDLHDGRIRLVAGLDSPHVEGAESRLARRWEVDVFDAHHDGWLDAWRPFAQPVRSGGILVQPSWQSVDPDQSSQARLIVRMDAGRAFGQGNHPSTRLTLGALEQFVESGSHVLDVGCGSGILAVTAALLGAQHVVAVDIEEEAVTATAENAELNGVSDRIDVSTTAVSELEGQFDVTTANILAPVLVELAPEISCRVRPGGALVLSGIRSDQRDEVLAAYGRQDLGPVSETAEDVWIALVLR